MRLSECGKYTVGVLEAGSSGLRVPIIDIPGDFGADLRTKYDCACAGILMKRHSELKWINDCI